MARWPRLVAPSFPLHVTQRGHNRDITFRDEQDFSCYREIVLQESIRTSCAIHAYALMSNHVHLLLTPTDPLGAARLMQRVGSRFVRYWNKRHHRTGTLWDGRFKSSIVDNDHYFLACCRYIDLNPVRAGIVRDAASYEWSSHQRLAHGMDDALITTHAAYDALAESSLMRQFAYHEYCIQGTSDRAAATFRHAVRSGAATGDRRFIDRMERLLRRPVMRRAHGGDRKSGGWQTSIR